jgi:D-2-hydroxyacid dehydrogenase (NADP+)
VLAGSRFRGFGAVLDQGHCQTDGRTRIQRDKGGAYLINVARGAVVDEIALTSALERKLIGRACLDFFAEEPLPRSSPLWTLPNVIITPHSSGLTSDYDERNAALIVDNLRRYHDREPLLNTVDLGTAL